MLAFYTKLDMLTRMGGALSCYCCLFFLAARRTSDDWPFARDACGTESVFSSCRCFFLLPHRDMLLGHLPRGRARDMDHRAFSRA